jgi:4'-phosphopantetheinyl transferase
MSVFFRWAQRCTTKSPLSACPQSTPSYGILTRGIVCRSGVRPGQGFGQHRCLLANKGFSSLGQRICQTSAHSSSLSSVAIKEGDVHVWWMPVVAPSTLEDVASIAAICQGLLEQDEEAAELQCAIDAILYAIRYEEESQKMMAGQKVNRLVARAYLRHVLSHYPPYPSPDQILFERNEHGKPRVVADENSIFNVNFNVTHSNGAVGVAVSLGMDVDVGIDVEAKDRSTRRIDELRLAKRYFSKAEMDMLERIPPGEDRRLFFVQLWTLKEAYVKALGRGIGAPPGLRSFGFQLDLARKNIRLETSDQEPRDKSWSFGLFEPVSGCVGALAMCSDSVIYPTCTTFMSPSLTSANIHGRAIIHETVENSIIASSNIIS